MSCHFSGSLVVRLVFSPFEEISYATFARGASGFVSPSFLFCFLDVQNLQYFLPVNEDIGVVILDPTSFEISIEEVSVWEVSLRCLLERVKAHCWEEDSSICNKVWKENEGPTSLRGVLMKQEVYPLLSL
ncbi:hypothetical protein AAG906_000466 [Vitis piasezkii]